MNADILLNNDIYYYIIQNEDKFKLDIKSSNETVIISVKKENNFSLKYSIKLELKDFINKNKIFKQYDSISDFIASIETLVEKNLITIKELEDKNICILEMIYSDAFFKENKISFELFAEDRNKDELIKDLISTVKNFEIKIKNLEKENESLKKEMNEIKNVLQKTNEEESLKKMMDFPSQILTVKKELDLLIYQISSMESKNVKILKKLYCASIDGDGAFY